MALKTALVIGGDASGAVAALQATDQALEAASAEVQAYGQAYKAADAAIGSLAQAQAEATREIAQAKAAYKANEMGLADYNRTVLETKSALSLVQGEYRGAMKALSSASADLKGANDNMGSLGGGAKLAGHHVQNLAFQFQDLGVQLASGANPMMAFVQQGSQIGGVLMQAGVGVGGMVRQLASMAAGFLVANPLLLAAAAAAGGAAVAFIGFQNTLEKKAPVDQYIKSLGLTAEEAAKLTDAHVTLGDTAGAAWDMIKQGFGLDKVFSSIKGWVTDATSWLYNAFKNAVASVYAAFKATYDNIGFIWSNLPSLLGDAVRLAVNTSIDRLQMLVNAGITGLNWLAAKANETFGTSFGQIARVDLGGLKATYSAAGQELGRRFGASFGAAKQEALAGFDRFEDAAIQRRNQRLADQAGEIIGKRSKESSASAGKAAGKEFVDKFAEELGKLRDAIDKALAAQSAELAKRLAAEAAGGVNWMREDMARQTAERVKPFRDAAEATAQWNAQMDAAIDRLDQIGGLGSTIAGWAKALRGDLSSLSGATGVAVQTILGMPAGSERVDGKDVALTLGDRIERIFKQDGAFGRTMKGLLEGAGTGLAIGTAIFGSNNQGAQIGGAIGGALGQVAGQAIGKSIGGALGSAMGPIGSVLGSVLGSVVGSIFGKRPRGSGTVTNSSVTTSANDGGIKSGLDSFGLGLQQSVSSIADKLGGTVGSYSVGIGAYKDYYQVSRSANDPYLGQSNYARKSGMDAYDGKDASAALRAAIAVAIEQGAIQGVRAGTQTLLKAGSDIEAQLGKALKFEGVFTDLKQQLNPLGYELEQLGKKGADLRKIFAEAKATTEEYAQLEQLLAMQRQQAIDQAGASFRSAFFTPEEQAAYARKIIAQTLTPLGYGAVDTVAGFKALVQGLDLTTEAGVTLYGQLMTVADEFETLQGVAESTTQAATQRRTMEIQLMELQGRTAEALAAKRALELSQMDESLRALQQQIYHQQDLADARAKLSTAYERESKALQDTIDKFGGLAADLRDYRAKLLGEGNSGFSYQAAMVQLMKTGALAGTGDATAMGSLAGVSKAFVDAARDNASSLQQYQRDVALAARYVDDAIAAADGAVSTAEEQLAEMKAQVGALIDINESVLSVREAIANLTALTAGATAASSPATGEDPRQVRIREERNADRLERLAALAETSTAAADRLARLLARMERNGALAVTTDPDAPVKTVAA